MESPFSPSHVPPGAVLQLKETVHDACFLHNELFFAVAQKK